MACQIPYLRNTNLSEVEKSRLEEIHTSIYEAARDSKTFRRIDNRFQTIKNLYPKATEFVGKINSQYGKPIASIKSIGNGNSVLSVNVLPLTEERIFLQKPKVEYQLKSVEILNSPKADEVFRKGDKNNWSIDKILQELQVPKEQQELIKSYNTRNREEILTSLLADYSYTVEVNTAKTKTFGSAEDAYYAPNKVGGYAVFNKQGKLFKNVNTAEEAEKLYYELIKTPTQYYSNLTVPGGTNYTENEIATPAITPSIKGHAQFATDKGIGWFRSDEQRTDDNKGKKVPDGAGGLVQLGVITDSKTRRILEVQSDLFQKGRDRESLIQYNINHEQEYRDADGGYDFLPANEHIVEQIKGDNQNQFLQLLNKDNNWVTFFVKSIIQDSAKKGYEKVLFPTGNTASKVEGHSTLEAFKKEKEDRIKELEKSKLNYNLANIGGGLWEAQYITARNAKEAFGVTAKNEVEAKEEINKKWNNEINQLKQELERVEKEGFGALKPIFNFYENTVTNILKKNYKINQLTDEYGNTWNEVEITPEIKEQKILLQKSTPIEKVAVSSKTIKLVKDLIERMGVKYDGGVNNIVVNGEKIDANGIANIMKGYIEVIDGKESEALPEEAMHFAVEIIEQKNPGLFNKMLSEINSFQVYSDVLRDYSNDPLYQTRDGKPDIRKLKKEAIAKQLVNTIINKVEGNSETYKNVAKSQAWWSQILDFIKSLFAKSGFDQAALDIISGKEIGTVEDIRSGDVYLQLDKQENLITKLKEVSSKIEKNDEGYFIDGKRIPRVTETIKTWADRMFEDRKLTQSEYDKLVDNLKAEKGTQGHADIEHAFSVFVDENGYLREEELDDSTYISQLNPNNKDFYELLKQNLKERLYTFPAGTRFLSEITVYNPSRNLAGTVDFLAITPEGKVSILDWKFMGLSDKYTDIPWYSVRSWNEQMTQYKLILEKAYNVDIKNFEQTRMIPILAKYSKGDKKKNELPKLLSIKIGDVNVKNIKEDYLLPVPLEGEKTGNKRIDSLLEKLNALYKQFSEKAVVPSKKQDKAEQLNALFTAIRQLQLKQNIKPLLHQAKVLNKQIEDIINRYNTEWSNKEVAGISQEQISKFTEEIESGLHAIQQYTTLDTELKFLFRGELNEEDEKLKQELRDVVDNARDLNSELFDISEQFADKFIAGSEEIKGSILSPEKVIKGITKWFVSTSGLQMKSLEVLFKKANRQLANAAMDTLNETKNLNTLKKNYDAWAISKGLDSKNYFDLIKKKDKNELIDEYKKEFYKELKSKISERDYKWIQSNVDVAAYKEHLKAKLENLIEREKNKNRVGTEEEIDRSLTFEINKLKDLYDVSTVTSVGWLLNTEIRKFPAKQWETEEWKELHKKGNEPALNFFNYIKERNEYYKEIGYINEKSSRVFLPFVRKGLMEKVLLGGDIRFGEHFLRSISIDEGDVGYGKIDPLTGRPIDVIPKYFTREIDGELSTDLFRTIALYNEAAIRFKYLSDIEAQARALIAVERNKKAIATSTFGKTVYKNGEIQYTPDNNENAQLLEDMVKGIVYGQRYLQSETFDQIIGKFGTLGNTINEKLGMKVFPENIQDRQISMNKLLTQLNTTFQLNALGLNPLSALSNLLGGSFNSIINAGTYFTKTDFIAAETQLTVNKFNGQDAKKMLAALEYFLPLTDNYNQQLAKKLSLSKFSQENVQEFLMILMRKSDWFVQTANFYAYINNSIVQDGKIVNVREYLRTLPEYKNMYEGTKQERDRKKSKFEEDVKTLINEKGVLKLSKIVDNQLVIEGVDRKDSSVADVRRKVQFLNKSALGNLSEDDLRLINMHIYGKSMMLFKNWIPRLVDVRAGNLKYNSASDAYEWGRMRMIFRILSEDTIKSLNSLYNIYTGNDEGITRIKQLWEAKKVDYELDTGRKLEMTEQEFVDLVRSNVRNQLTDSLIMLSLFGSFLALGAFGPDEDEDDNTKNVHKYLLRATDKVKDELWFFYDPTSLTSLVSSGIFPSISYINTLKKAIGNFGKEVYGLSIGDEELVDKNYVIKYAMKSFPITSQGNQILPLFYPELAKDLGIKTSSQGRAGAYR
jgi:hypothetical protein